MKLIIECPNCNSKDSFEFQEAYYKCAVDGKNMGIAPPPTEPEGIPVGDYDCDETERICVYMCLQCGCLAEFYGL